MASRGGPRTPKKPTVTGWNPLAKSSSNWPKSRKGDRKGRKAGYPKPKTKNKTTPRFAYTAGGLGLIDGNPKTLRLPKTGRVHYMENATNRVGDGRVPRMTISQHAGR